MRSRACSISYNILFLSRKSCRRRCSCVIVSGSHSSNSSSSSSSSSISSSSSSSRAPGERTSSIARLI